MYVIKFSHNYYKLSQFNLNEKFYLLMVVKTFKENLSKYFIEYDTLISGADFYKLPAGAIIILFLMQGSKMFTTIRRYTPNKMKFYKSLEGKGVKCIVS